MSQDTSNHDIDIVLPEYSNINTRRPFYVRGLTLILAWISNHMPNKSLDEITYPFPNFNDSTVEVWEWISDFIPRFIMAIIIYPCRD